MRHFVLSIIYVFFLSGCVAYNKVQVIEPIRPELPPAYGDNIYEPITAESLNPILEWKGVSDEEVVSFDVIIYEGISQPPGNSYFAGKSVYYRGGIKETFHKVEYTLKPRTIYVWSVRIRTDNSTSEWATWARHVFAVAAYNNQSNIPFVFKTPDK